LLHHAGDIVFADEQVDAWHDDPSISASQSSDRSNLGPDPYQRTDYSPGELAQWDLWFPAVQIPFSYRQTARLLVIVGVPVIRA
jgi:hypothetical protein